MENADQTETFQEALERFLTTVQGKVNEYFAQHYKNLQPFKLTIDLGGQKYYRIVQNDQPGGGRSAWGFIEVATGNILKCDGWKRPAKGVRGSVYAKDYEGYGVDIYGPRYLNKR